MNPKVKKLWVDALRSGEYSQTKGDLCIKRQDGTYGFCCLGVLSNLYLLEHPDTQTEFWGTPQPSVRFCDNGYGSYGSLSSSVIQWAGLDDHNPTVNYKNNSSVHLSALNDVHRLKFPTIAKLIEEQL